MIIKYKKKQLLSKFTTDKMKYFSDTKEFSLKTKT